MAALDVIQRMIGEMFEVEEEYLGFLLSAQNITDYDYGDSIQDLGDFCLDISHEDFSRRQIFIIFSFFGKIKAILSHGYVKIFFWRYDDAVSAFSALKDVVAGLALSSELRRRIPKEAGKEFDDNNNVDGRNDYDGLSYAAKLSLKERMFATKTDNSPISDVAVDSAKGVAGVEFASTNDFEVGGLESSRSTVSRSAESTNSADDSESGKPQRRSTDSRVAHRIIISSLGLSNSPILTRKHPQGVPVSDSGSSSRENAVQADVFGASSAVGLPPSQSVSSPKETQNVSVQPPSSSPTPASVPMVHDPQSASPPALTSLPSAASVPMVDGPQAQSASPPALMSSPSPASLPTLDDPQAQSASPPAFTSWPSPASVPMVDDPQALNASPPALMALPSPLSVPVGDLPENASSSALKTSMPLPRPTIKDIVNASDFHLPSSKKIIPSLKAPDDAYQTPSPSPASSISTTKYASTLTSSSMVESKEKDLRGASPARASSADLRRVIDEIREKKKSTSTNGTATEHDSSSKPRRVIDQLERDNVGRHGAVTHQRALQESQSPVSTSTRLYVDYDRVKGGKGDLYDSVSYRRASNEARSSGSQYHSYRVNPFDLTTATLVSQLSDWGRVERTIENGRGSGKKCPSREETPTRSSSSSNVESRSREQQSERLGPRRVGSNRLFANALNEIEKQFKGLNVK